MCLARKYGIRKINLRFFAILFLNRLGQVIGMEWKRRAAIVGIVVGVYAGFRYLFPAAFPFLVGWILAVWIYPLAVQTEKRLHVKRGIAGCLYMLLLMGAAGFLLYKGLEIIFVQVRLAVASYHGLEAWGMKALNRCCYVLEEWTGIQAMDTRKYLLGRADQMQASFLNNFSPAAVVEALSKLKWIVALLSGVVLAFLSGILFLKDMEEMRRQVRRISWMRSVLHISKRMKETTVMYLKAQFTIMAVIAAQCSLGFWILKSPYYLVLGIGLGFLDMLPVIGTGTFLYPAALVLLLQGNTKAAIGCVVMDLVTSFTREFLEPRLLGKSMGVYPVVILAAVYGGFFLYGWAGFLLGPLSLSLIYEIGREYELWE